MMRVRQDLRFPISCYADLTQRWNYNTQAHHKSRRRGVVCAWLFSKIGKLHLNTP